MRGLRFGLAKPLSLLLCGLFLVSCSSSAAEDGNFEEKVLQVIRENPQVVMESVQAYQQQEREQVRQARRQFLQQMLSDPAAVIGDSPTQGAQEQEIVLFEFSDFQCPFCAKAHKTVDRFMEKHGDRVTLTYKYLPLESIHPEAIPAARAAWAADRQGKFWPYRDRLFEQQDELGEALYEEIAQALDLGLEQFNRDRNSDAAEAAIQKDLDLAKRLQLTSTPIFFLNEEMLTGAVELSNFEEALNRVVSARK